MRKARRFGVGFLLLLVAMSGFSIKIAMVELVGALTVPREQILGVIQYCKEGNDVTYANIESDLFQLTDLGYFQNVQYRLTDYAGDTKIITFEFEEYPYVREVKVKLEGPKLLDMKTIQTDYMLLEENKALNYKKLIRTMNGIKNFFITSGYTTIEVFNNLQRGPEGSSIPDNILEITVREYGLYDIVLTGELGDITYEEVKELMGLRLIKDLIDDFWKWLKNEKKYYPTTLDYQMALSRMFSTGLLGESTGYRFDVIEQPLENGMYGVNLVLDIRLNPVVPEGQPISQIVFTGNSLLPSSELIKGLRSSLYPQTVLMDVLRDAQHIKKVYEEEGYPYTIVTPRYDKNSGVLTFSVSEGFVGEVRLQGLQKTQEYLVWPHIRLKPGNAIKMSDLRQTYINLNRTGYFESVDIDSAGFSPTSTRTVLIVNLVENTTSVTVNAGVSFDPRNAGDSIAQQIYGKISLSLVNPVGRGQSISLSAVLGKYPNFSLSYGIDRVFGSPFDAGISLDYQNQLDYRTVQYGSDGDTPVSTMVFFENESYRIIPNLSFHIGDFQTITTDFTWGKYQRAAFSPATLTISDVSTPASDYFSTKGDIYTLGLGYTFDKRDDETDPTEGFQFFTRAEWSLPFATEPWLKLHESFSLFYSFAPRHTIGGRIFLGQSVFDKLDVLGFAVGGGNNFFIRGIAPYNATFSKNMAVLNFEYRFRITQEGSFGVQAAAFMDNGIGFDSFGTMDLMEDWRTGIGGGFRFNIPGFGLLRLDVGWDFSPMVWQSGGPKWGGIYFGFGQMF
ncbi:MAG TPA: BamA/TamA family outer membrane protein [Thermotogota bacterium]|nr:BamA/TamA family outer membrane protein [Thermotogota bacterium]